MDYPTVNRYKIVIKILELGYGLDVLDGVLSSLQDSIVRAKEESDKIIESKKPEEYVESLLEEKASVVEGLVGCGFVASQTYITDVVDKILSLHELSENERLSLSVTGKKKHEVRQHGPHTIVEAHSDASVINALSNYFKHQEEWTHSDWENPSGSSKHTIPKIKSVGVSEIATNNLMNVRSEFLDDDLTLLKTKLTNWKDRLVTNYKQELSSHSLL